jgi:hypothetical protein
MSCRGFCSAATGANFTACGQISIHKRNQRLLDRATPYTADRSVSGGTLKGRTRTAGPHPQHLLTRFSIREWQMRIAVHDAQYFETSRRGCECQDREHDAGRA